MKYIDKWLSSLGLEYVIPKLLENGITTPKKLAQLSLKDIYDRVGIEDNEDRKKLYFLIQRLQTILNKSDGQTEDDEEQDNFTQSNTPTQSEDRSREDFPPSITSAQKPISNPPPSSTTPPSVPTRTGSVSRLATFNRGQPSSSSSKVPSAPSSSVPSTSPRLNSNNSRSSPSLPLEDPEEDDFEEVWRQRPAPSQSSSSSASSSSSNRRQSTGPGAGAGPRDSGPQTSHPKPSSRPVGRGSERDRERDQPSEEEDLVALRKGRRTSTAPSSSSSSPRPISTGPSSRGPPNQPQPQRIRELPCPPPPTTPIINPHYEQPTPSFPRPAPLQPPYPQSNPLYDLPSPPPPPPPPIPHPSSTFLPISSSDPSGQGQGQVCVEDMMIRVVVRKRPLTRGETTKGDVDVMEIGRGGRVWVHEPKIKVDLTRIVETQSFTFDDAFDADEPNESIYHRTISPLISFVFEGGKASCFAYGQTGSGKTFSMMGSRPEAPMEVEVNAGLYVLAGKDIFKRLRQPQFSHLQVFASCFEIYGGKLFDLLNHRNVVRCLEDDKKQVQVCGLSEHRVSGVTEFLSLMAAAHGTRSVGSTGANSESSRSHLVMQIVLKEGDSTLSQGSGEAGARGGAGYLSAMAVSRKGEKPSQKRSSIVPAPKPASQLRGKISFIDLAGSERGADTYNNSKQTRMEGAEINTSLLALKEVIRSLEKKQGHTPFRGSKLTQVLKDSFVGDRSRTCMIACVSPAHSNCEHTLNTLRYADRVKEHQSGPSNPSSFPAPSPEPISHRSSPTQHPERDRERDRGSPVTQYDEPPPRPSSSSAGNRRVSAGSSPSPLPNSNNNRDPPSLPLPSSPSRIGLSSPTRPRTSTGGGGGGGGIALGSNNNNNNNNHYNNHRPPPPSSSLPPPFPSGSGFGSPGGQKPTNNTRRVSGGEREMEEEEDFMDQSAFPHNPRHPSPSPSPSSSPSHFLPLNRSPSPITYPTPPHSLPSHRQPPSPSSLSLSDDSPPPPPPPPPLPLTSHQFHPSSSPSPSPLYSHLVSLLSRHKSAIAEMVEVMKHEMQLVQDMEDAESRDSERYVDQMEMLLEFKEEAINKLREEVNGFMSWKEGEREKEWENERERARSVH